jgi:hypothetical protein
VLMYHNSLRVKTGLSLSVLKWLVILRSAKQNSSMDP